LNFRNIPLAEVNMTNVIFSYYIEVVNIMMLFCTVPMIYVYCIYPLPLVWAQLAFIGVQSCASLINGLGAAVSCFHILYVLKFEAVFPLDPHEAHSETIV
jgi:hypothetical protein